MGRMIDADALDVISTKIPDSVDADSYIAGMAYVASKIDAQPTVEQRKTGKWVYEERKRLIDETDDGAVYSVEKWWKCSECGAPKGYIGYKPTDKFCYECGASMMKGGQP